MAVRFSETLRVFPYFPRLSGAPIIPRRPDEFVPWSGLRGNELDGSQAKSAAKRNHLRACVGVNCLPPSVLRFRTEHRGGPADRRERWEWTEVEEMRSRRLTGVEGVRLRSLEVGGGGCGEEGDGDARGRRKRMAVREWTGWRWMWGRGCGWREWWWLKRRTGEERWVEEGMDGLQMDGQRGTQCLTRVEGPGTTEEEGWDRTTCLVRAGARRELGPRTRRGLARGGASHDWGLQQAGALARGARTRLLEGLAREAGASHERLGPRTRGWGLAREAGASHERLGPRTRGWAS
ncbi:unnamed protein product [Boreogadus saida]